MLLACVKEASCQMKINEWGFFRVFVVVLVVDFSTVVLQCRYVRKSCSMLYVSVSQRESETRGKPSSHIKSELIWFQNSSGFMS